ncbi:DMT family transporter [Bacillus sp. SCS-151]|uniref:DMT family transporter n=1 Tax=Nanhaiella sioensis TaxID=3115293 RepID=UPI003978CD31
MTAERFFSHKLGMIAAAAAATFLWGSAFPFIKLSYEELNIQPNEIGEQILFAGYRFILASLMIMVFYVFIKRNIFLKKSTIKPLVHIGLYQTFFQYVLFYIGLSYSTGIQGSIIAGTTSLFQMIFAHFMYNDDSLNRKKVVGVLVGFTGVILVNITRGSFSFSFGLGEFLLLLAMVSGAFGNLKARNGSFSMDVGYLTAYQMLFGSFGLLGVGMIMAGIFPFEFTVKSLFLLLYLAFLSAAGFVLWNNVMKYNQVGKVSMFLFLVPVFGVILSSILLQESIHFFVVFGLLFVTSGIIIVNRPDRKRLRKVNDQVS